MTGSPDTATINRNLYDALLVARPYVHHYTLAAELVGLPDHIVSHRRSILDQIDGALADAQGEL